MDTATSILGVDTGGTFTDFILVRNGRFEVFKTLSTPSNPAEAVAAGLERLLGGSAARIVHGSTVATNAILERKGVKTALVANRGFTDVIEIGRQNRSRLYDLFYRKKPHIVPRELRFGVGGRTGPGGEEIAPLSKAEAREAARLVRESGAESVAVCLLFSFADPAHEKLMGEALAETGLPVSLSHEILAEFREFERTSTTVVNAYVSPKMSRYLGEVKRAAGDNPLMVMQSNGGGISVDTAGTMSVRTILSGPAGGVVGASALAKAAGFGKIITFDMGGTSTDVCLVDGEPPLTLEAVVAGYPVKAPMIDIHTVGAGGGSLADVDAGGALTVGPESAGADPGPACYGRGEGVTVTDANLFLGRLVPDRFLGGDMRLAPERVRGPMASLAARAGISDTEAALGVLTVANANMERAIRVISVERGFDPREFALFTFGGAGGLHCAFLARLLGMSTVVVPENPGILSALGMVLADVVKDFSRTVMLKAEETDPDRIAALFAPLEEQAGREMSAEGFPAREVALERSLDMRYQGQSFEIVTPLETDFTAAFEALHERTYGYRNTGKPVEVVNLRLRARGASPAPAMPVAEEMAETVPGTAELGVRRAVFQGGETDIRVLKRESLLPGNRFSGPAVVVEYSSTIVVPPFASARVDPWGNLVMEID